jgi:iron-siderophore transport system permease protein
MPRDRPLPDAPPATDRATGLPLATAGAAVGTGAGATAPAARTGFFVQDGSLVWRARRVDASLRMDLRAVAVTAVLLAHTAVLFAWSLAVGDFPIPVTEVVATLFGYGSDSADFIVRTLRLPRGIAAVLVGAAFGMAGAIFQRLLRNPLATPDILGINMGATVGAVAMIVLWSGSNMQVTVGALAGAGVAALALYVLAFKHGTTGYRMVLVGIGLTAMCTACVSWLLTRAQIYQAQRAVVWITGSLADSSWEQVRWVGVALAGASVLAFAAGRRLRVLELGDDLAQGLGVSVSAAHAWLVVAGSVLAATATAAAGPIAFVALLSPEIARRLVGARSLGLVTAAGCGALLVTASDLVARRLFAPGELPVGVVTAILGAPYLLYLMARANRIGSGG